jgi:chromate transport protein
LIIVLVIAVLVSQFKFPPIMVIIVGAIAGNIWMMNRKGAK